ncbi:hypothetical protein RRG08_018423 [Elysia crispata]|uniref:UvrD-like helicase C-terminal domain-containing protein n=1 Tax=Elysia crispata TaxID=231223 RepID=A0AAE1ECX4_9GAST|nr:hypothetical protein RRG08_018423 [Elysia crispata]
MLLRNFRLLSGNRLRVLKLGRRVIEVVFLSVSKSDTRVFTPRIILSCLSQKPALPSKRKRRLFPLNPCFAVTISKAEGQTLPLVEIFLLAPVFTNRQLYVAVSRARSFERISTMRQSI